MGKRKKQHTTLELFEVEADRFISLVLAYSETEQSRTSRPHPLSNTPVSTAMAAAALSVQESIKAFLAVTRIYNN